MVFKGRLAGSVAGTADAVVLDAPESFPTRKVMGENTTFTTSNLNCLIELKRLPMEFLRPSVRASTWGLLTDAASEMLQHTIATKANVNSKEIRDIFAVLQPTKTKIDLLEIHYPHRHTALYTALHFRNVIVRKKWSLPVYRRCVHELWKDECCSYLLCVPFILNKKWTYLVPLLLGYYSVSTNGVSKSSSSFFYRDLLEWKAGV